MKTIKIFGTYVGIFGSLFAPDIANLPGNLYINTLSPIGVAGASVIAGLSMILLGEFLDRKTTEINKKHNWEKYREKKRLLKNYRDLDQKPIELTPEVSACTLQEHKDEVEFVMSPEDEEMIDEIRENVIEEE